ncbi:MAG: leucine-rich repeat domain-containing protein [Treponema sp.]|nr:leucine-rich repeat domain-containing protein [Treponema sp.]
MRKFCLLFTGLIALVAALSFMGCPQPDSGGDTNETPAAADFNVSGLSPIFDGSAKAVNISPKTGKSAGAITIHYEGISGTAYSKETAAPSVVGAYAVTFDVAAATGWNAVSGLYAGTLAIAHQTFTPTAADFDISGLSQVFDGSAKAVNISPKPGKSSGKITTYYEGIGGTSYTKKTAAPSAIGAYAVTFDVAAATGWNAATGLSAGTLAINVPSFTSIAKFETWLHAQPENTAAAPYAVALTVDDLGGYNNTAGSVGNALYTNPAKYVSLDLSGSTFTSINFLSFYKCAGLTSIIIPDSVISITPHVYNASSAIFSGCTCLTVIDVNEGNTIYSSIDGVVYSKDKSALILYPTGKTGTFIIPNGVTSIEAFAFSECRNLAAVTIPASVTSIKERAFYDCTSLASVTIPDSVTSIGRAAFRDCSSLVSVTFEGTIASSDFDDESFYSVFPGNLRTKFYETDSTSGTPGTYTRTPPSTVWTMQ